MPSKKPRIGLTVPNELDEVLTALSAELGQPKTALIVEILMQQYPVLQQLLEGIRSAKSGNKDAAMNFMASMLKDAGFVLDEAQSDFFELKRKHNDRG